MDTRQHWGTKIGFLLAAIGSAVGLGNIWKFPDMMGQNGGAVFLLLYVVCVILVGIPVLVVELLVGKRNQLNAVDAVKKEFPKGPFFLSGWFGLITSILIMGYYIVVAGWCMFYIYEALINHLNFSSIEASGTYFSNFVSSATEPLFWILIFMLINFGILFAGVKQGIEKASKILMPLLAVILIILAIRALTLGDGVEAGLKYMFNPDLSKLSGTVVLNALGLAFFKLSLGMGVMITYGSFLKDKTNLVSSSANVALWDTVVSIIAGLAIFPTIFALSSNPLGNQSLLQSTGLVFETIPTLLNTLPLGQLFAVLFFIALAVAALTSSISIYEVMITFFTEKFNVSRKKVLSVSAVILTFLGIAVSVTLAWKIPGIKLDLFDTFDMVTSDFLMPLGGLLLTIGVGWVLKKKEFFADVKENIFGKATYIFIRYVAPVIIAIIFVYGVYGLITSYIN